MAGGVVINVVVSFVVSIVRDDHRGARGSPQDAEPELGS